MMKVSLPKHRGLTLVELLLSLTITVVIGMAMTSVIGAVVSGVDTRRDGRSHIVRGYAAQSRLLAYIVPSRAILHADDNLIVFWFGDSRQSDTVHGTEVRWLEFNADWQTVTAQFVKFPDNWRSVEKWLADREHAHDANWRSVLNDYRAAGHLELVTLIDGVSAMGVSIDQTRPIDSSHITLRLTLDSDGREMTTHIAGTLRRHSPPVR